MKMALVQVVEKQMILEAPAILCDQELNLHVSLGGDIRGIIPKNEVLHGARDEQKDIAILTRVGKPVCFKVMGFSKNARGEKVAMLSRRMAQIECIENYIKNNYDLEIAYYDNYTQVIK